jgi:hypothetical protein
MLRQIIAPCYCEADHQHSIPQTLDVQRIESIKLEVPIGNDAYQIVCASEGLLAVLITCGNIILHMLLTLTRSQ